MNLKDAGIYDLINIFKGIGTVHHSAAGSSIINNEAKIINIPAYQRPYRWEIENIERLFSDYEDNDDTEYFLGSAVIVRKDRGAGNVEYDVVDGQQRITTLFLLNYIRFLLKRELFHNKLVKKEKYRIDTKLKELEESYIDLIGKNRTPFDNMNSKMEELERDKDLDGDEKSQKLLEYYEDEFCIPKNKKTPDETLSERKNKAKLFFKSENEICLKYSRQRYNDILKEVLCDVFISKVENTNQMKLDRLDETEDAIKNRYIEAQITLFNNVWEKVSGDASADENEYDICERAVSFIDELLRNLSLCVVLTENDNDANKLFEVLNDRALDVDDLELIKNHFYKEYCTKSSDSDSDKDIRITELDELWTDKIFSDNGVNKTKLISYLSAVYLTGDTELIYKDNVKYKDAIDRKYSVIKYPSGGNEYGYKNITEDFNVYFANKIILELFDVRVMRKQVKSLEAEQEKKSISYKAMHLINAMDYYAIMPALTNVIISSFAQQNKNVFSASDFETKFKTFVQELIDDDDNNTPKFQKIHQCAYVLWRAAIKGKDYIKPRDIAKRIIGKYNRQKDYDSNPIDFLGTEMNALNNELDSWIKEWTFANKKTFAVKVLLVNLMASTRTIDTSSNTATLDLKVLANKLNASELQLDHLEADKINTSNKAAYFMSDDIEKRQKIVNGFIGNFMVLDAKGNNNKNNKPMITAKDYYKKFSTSWLVKDINMMISDTTYFDKGKKIPKEEFFIHRTRILTKYFKAFLDKPLEDTSVDVNLT